MLHLLLIAEPARGRLDRPAILLDRADLDARAADIAREDAHAAFVLERRGDGADDAVVDRGVGQIAPYQRVAVHLGHPAIGAEIVARDGADVAGGQPGLEPFADHERRGAGGRAGVAWETGDERRKGDGGMGSEEW